MFLLQVPERLETMLLGSSFSLNSGRILSRHYQAVLYSTIKDTTFPVRLSPKKNNAA